MCGILGRIGFDDKHYNQNDFNIFSVSLDLQKHRGPDGRGVFENDKFIFGHRRLSIIDVGNHSDQPMLSKCGNYILVFNGEIYNYLELKKDLINKGYIFDTHSDTEVLLNSFIEYGVSCVDNFIGMFAFSIFDKHKDEFYIVRDRLGVKPLYYVKNDQEIIFSSEIKSILEIDKSYIQLNKQAISSYMSFRYPILNDTFFKGVNSLPPAHYLKISNSSNVEVVEYWSLCNSFKEQKNDKGEEYYLKNLRSLLGSSVEYRMISDVPFGAFLSGGVDSGVITSIMSKNSSTPIKTYNIGFEEQGYNEFEYANIIKSKFKTDHHEIVMNADDYMETMDELISYKDAPLSVPNEVPLYLMCKKLKKKITVVLSGEGADEIFGGYGRIFRSTDDYEKLKDIDNQNISDIEKKSFCKSLLMKYAATEFSNELDHFMNIYSYTSYKEKCDLLHSDCNLQDTESILYKKFLDYFDEISNESYLNKMMYVFEKVHLLGLLHRVDTTSMAASVEARVPFVDHRLVEFAFTIPEKYKLKWTKNDKPPFHLMSDKISEVYDIPKYILKKCYEGEIPNEVLYRKKVGFPVPLNTWFSGNFRKYAKDILLSEKANSRKIFNSINIEKWIDRDSLSQSHGDAMKIWMLINLELFCSKYFDQRKEEII
jgi:asparagine synthase (glutamine-hydrolysing)